MRLFWLLLWLVGASPLFADEGAKPLVTLSEELDQALIKGVDYLCSNQNSNGSWGSARKTKGLNLLAPAPGAHHAFRMGASALALQGLLSSGDQREPTVQAIAKCELWLIEALPRLRRAGQSTIYNIWGHAYALRALAALEAYHHGDKGKKATLTRLAEQQVQMLYRYEFIGGGWGYYDFRAQTQRPSGDSMSFTTATVLLSLRDARDGFGIVLDERIIQRALRSLLDQRLPDGSFTYAQNHWKVPRIGVNRPAGSLARSQACNVALHAFAQPIMTQEGLMEWLDRLIKRDGFLSNGRKRPIPHETHFQISGYFYYYGHYYASEAFSLLPPEAQELRCEPLLRLILAKQEKNGSWWDYPLFDYHQAYGTGYALTTLSRYRKALPHYP